MFPNDCEVANGINKENKKEEKEKEDEFGALKKCNRPHRAPH
jgi:hypothetical protein